MTAEDLDRLNDNIVGTSHRYLPAAPAERPAPVFSVHQTDLIYYGNDLADYVVREFRLGAASALGPPAVRVPFWSDLAEGADQER